MNICSLCPKLRCCCVDWMSLGHLMEIVLMNDYLVLQNWPFQVRKNTRFCLTGWIGFCILINLTLIILRYSDSSHVERLRIFQKQRRWVVWTHMVTSYHFVVVLITDFLCSELHRCAVFCLLQVGTEIHDTELVIVDRTLTDVCFEEPVILWDTPHFIQKKRKNEQY